MRYFASSPAKCILFGEHAVVYDEPAIVMAVGLRARVGISPRDDSLVKITSQDLGASATFDLSSGKAVSGDQASVERLLPAYRAVEETAKALGKSRGAEVVIESEIPPAAGLGSSAAVAVSTVAAYAKMLGQELPPERVSSIAYEAEKVVHGTPSGVDNTISSMGGFIAFRRSEGWLRIESKADFELVVGDTKIERSTKELVARVRSLKESFPDVINPIIHAIGHISIEAAKALREGDIESVGKLMDVNHGALWALGVSHETLDRLVYAAKKAGALGAKLTGAGGGGCMIALCRPGTAEAVARAIREAGGWPMVAKPSPQGVVSWEEA